MNTDYKEHIVAYINKKYSETYIVSDLFFNTEPRSGKLHPLGFKLLKDEYEFFSTEIDSANTPNYMIELTKMCHGLYYLESGKNPKIYCTNEDSINLIVLMGNKINR